jgi:hypothetical protein
VTDQNAAYGLVLPFDSDDPEFTRGVQIGMVWERVSQAGRVDGQLGVRAERGDGDADR